MATAYFDPSFQAYALQARTTAAGAGVDDVTGEDMRLILELYTEGIVGADSFVVAENSAGASMNVEVGSGVADTDKAILEGLASGQGNYMARMVDASDLLTVPAADLSNPRIDEVYLVVQDSGYDSSANVVPRLAYRDGTPASSPSAPGPDADWEAYLLLATVEVAANETAIEDAHITDERVQAELLDDLIPDHGTTHATAGDDPINVGGYVEFGGATESTQDQTLSTTYETGASDTFTKPASWTSYKIMAWGSVTYINNAAGTSIGESRILIDGNAGTTSGAIASASAASNTASPMVRHARTGLTGNAVVAIQYRETSNDMWKAGSCVNYVAVRTS